MNGNMQMMLEYLMISANELDDVIRNITIKSQES